MLSFRFISVVSPYPANDIYHPTDYDYVIKDVRNQAVQIASGWWGVRAPHWMPVPRLTQP